METTNLMSADQFRKLKAENDQLRKDLSAAYSEIKRLQDKLTLQASHVDRVADEEYSRRQAEFEAERQQWAHLTTRRQNNLGKF